MGALFTETFVLLVEQKKKGQALITQSTKNIFVSFVILSLSILAN